MKTRVVHVMLEPHSVYIGRGRNGIWGNPYSHKQGTMARFIVATPEEAVEKYREYILGRPDLLARLGELFGEVLGCWCKTKNNPNAPCHGDVLVELIKEKFGDDI